MYMKAYMKFIVLYTFFIVWGTSSSIEVECK